MTKKKARKINYKQRLRILKKLHFIEPSELDGRKKITGKSKNRISRLWRDHKEIVESKKVEFAPRKVSKSDLAAFKALDYKTFKGRVYINTEKAQSIRMGVEYFEGVRVPTVHKRINGKRVTEYAAHPEHLHLVAEALSKRDYKEGEYLTGHFGGRTMWKRSRFKSIEELDIYLKLFQPQQSLNKKYHRTEQQQAELKQELITQMSIVYFVKEQ